MHIKNFLPLLAIGLGLETGLAQSNIQVSDATKLLAVLQSPREKPVLVNFWATWCKPCVAELPHFEQVMKENADAYDMIYVSLDMVEELSERVEPFVKKKGLSGTHILLDDADLNAFIGRRAPPVERRHTRYFAAGVLRSKVFSRRGVYPE
ncbi:MAG: TlpA family protein disulfide reductase [Cytophagales bacterium]|nr:TlpA family protein disulfide reductase [Cytophagales bacterium]